jgi:hypothetical protein
MPKVFEHTDKMIVKPNGNITYLKQTDWNASDWLGVIGVIVAIAFVITVGVALYQRKDPLKMLQYMRDILVSTIKEKRGKGA